MIKLLRTNITLPDPIELANFNKIIDNGVKNLELDTGTFTRNKKIVLYSKAPIILKYSLNGLEN